MKTKVNLRGQSWTYRRCADWIAAGSWRELKASGLLLPAMDPLEGPNRETNSR